MAWPALEMALADRRRHCYSGVSGHVVGALVNRFRVDVREVDFEFPHLPAAFDGFKIVQISDLHVGTYGDDDRFVRKLVGVINGLHPDAVMFTGDIVNRHSSELIPFVDALSGIEAPYGVFSILGNHDYGDYATGRRRPTRLLTSRLFAPCRRAWDGSCCLIRPNSYIRDAIQ